MPAIDSLQNDVRVKGGPLLELSDTWSFSRGL
jgi:hypothetical protein